jgi:dUTP pyrophosphatase
MTRHIAPVAVPVIRLSDDARLPCYATDGAAGMDVAAAEAIVLPPGGRAAVGTGLCIAVPEGYEIQVRARSGLALRDGLFVLNGPGTIDSDYRGELKIIIANIGSEQFEITKGMRIAQLLLAPVVRIAWAEVNELSPTARATGGFGSTGRF